jgi:hypothetical protein
MNKYNVPPNKKTGYYLLGELFIRCWRWMTLSAFRQQTPPAKKTTMDWIDTMAAADAATVKKYGTTKD